MGDCRSGQVASYQEVAVVQGQSARFPVTLKVVVLLQEQLQKPNLKTMAGISGKLPNISLKKCSNVKKQNEIKIQIRNQDGLLGQMVTRP